MSASRILAVCGEEGAVSPQAERDFFAKVRLPNGTWKTTYPNRLDDLNERLLEFLPRDRPLDLMDVAISSGVSTLEWSEHLTANGIRYKLVAGDLVTEVRLVNWGSRLVAVLDAGTEEPLLLEMGSLAVPVRSDRRAIRMLRPVLPRLLRVIPGGRWRTAPLVRADLRRRPEVEVVQDDVMIPGRYRSAFDAVRAANLVQPGYFDDETLRKLIVNLRDRLRDGGLLAICRTREDGVNTATIFRRDGDHFVSEASINDGSEVRDLVLAL